MTGALVVDSKGGAAAADDSRMTPLGIVLVTLSAVSGILFGYDTGVVSGAMLVIKSSIVLTDFWHELIVAGTIASAWVFSLIGGYWTDRYGRRKTILAAAMVFTVGSLVMGFATGKEMLLVGRLIVGVGVGLASMSTPMYIAESSSPKYRGVLVLMYTVGVTGGQFVAGIISGVLSGADQGWRWMLGLGALPSVVLVVGFLFLPESPRWLVASGRLDDAEAVLRRLRGPDAKVSEEVKAIKEACDEQLKQKQQVQQNVLMQILRTEHARRALFLSCALQAYQQLGGINTVMYYSASILKMSGIGDDSTAIWLSAGVAGVNCVCTFIGMVFVDRLGRRPLALGSLFGACVSLVILGLGFLLMDHTAPPVTDVNTLGDACAAFMGCSACTSPRTMCGFCVNGNSTSCWPRDEDTNLALGGACMSPLTADMEWAVGYCPSTYSWIAVAALVLYLFCFAPGMGAIPWVVNAEVHSLWARDLSTSIATSSNWLLNLVVSISFLSLIDALTAAGAFFFYAVVAFTGVILLWFIQPETKGVSLEDMPSLFVKHRIDANENSAVESKIQAVKTVDA
ncbi:proton myo-inositol cotransporter-like isoform X2 [Thrips palmi]|uniref:Proton myo-inositol cotransporter-like isoform X2 n=1 Tax=Thrips palmi TaxID=161013 RepID=A0A6P8YAW4_THRPL|nr:proton myo-inositol cotransporter-like isoform X2 [Thrips palmi]